MLRPVLVMGLAISTCSQGSGASSTPPSADATEASGGDPSAPVLTAEGPPVEATVPLLGGSAVDLTELRGRVVLLELSASDRPLWQEAQGQYRRLVETLGEDRLVVVTVATDPDSDHLRQFWDRDKPPFVLGWDPQGALALRLGVTVLPTVLVLDRQGRKLARIDGKHEQFLRQVEQVVRAAVDQG
jgi:hypothetical protein